MFKNILSLHEQKKISEQEILNLVKNILDENPGKSWVQEIIAQSQTKP